MNALRTMLFVAAIAGLFAGAAMTLMQFATTVPLIFEAETFETAGDEAPHDHAAAAAEPAATEVATAAPAAHEHAAEEWAPADGFERSGLTVLANLVTSIAFGLLVLAASESLGGIHGWRQGMAWGLAGFAVFTLAPGLGLPPNMPGMPSAEIEGRQIWWVATALLTAGGLGLIAYGRSLAFGAVGVVLLVLPHLVGAPQPVDASTAVPAALHHQFIVAVTVTNLVFWLVLGTALALVRARFAAELDPAERRLA